MQPLHVLAALLLVSLHIEKIDPKSVGGSRRGVYFSSFGEYLMEATTNSENLQKLEGENLQPLIPPQEMVRYFQKVPKHHWSCCMLGQLAGKRDTDLTDVAKLKTKKPTSYDRMKLTKKVEEKERGRRKRERESERSLSKDKK
ncbi:DgyrCDS720 [Dimorphilus gyrociliatus]|uniref:DgyrCDS720 n=1 Tax=Dimorphilus gyrociliatus TaxID=2664684 RepID=A0A7I8V591_9ANNE|nr:DgyrCDS720 [Dimorphilus gyrociliatus]